jgi:hypothetical protein
MKPEGSLPHSQGPLNNSKYMSHKSYNRRHSSAKRDFDFIKRPVKYPPKRENEYESNRSTHS